MAKTKTYDMKTWPMLFKQCGKKVMEWEIWVEEQNDGTGIIYSRFGYTGGKKQTEQDHVKKGKNEGRKNATTPYQQAVLEAESEWKTKLSRKGYGETADASAAVRGISCMLAKTLKPKVAVDWATAFAQPKLDGFRCLATFGKKGVELRSRENQPFKFPHLSEQLALVMEQGETFDGELYSHDLTFSQISSAVKNKKKLDNILLVRFHAYDMVADWDFATRFERLRKALGQGMEHLDLVKTVKVRNKEDLAVVEQECLDEGYEGAMLRHSRAGYVNGKRADCLLKVKQFTDKEFVVVDAKPGRGKYDGMAIFTCKTEKGHDFDVLAPGTLPEKRAFWDNYKNYLGKKLTVKFFEYTTGDEPVPRFPIAKAFRD